MKIIEIKCVELEDFFDSHEDFDSVFATIVANFGWGENNRTVVSKDNMIYAINKSIGHLPPEDIAECKRVKILKETKKRIQEWITSDTQILL